MISQAVYLYIITLGSTSSNAAWSARAAGTEQDHSGGPGIIEANEQIIFTPLPRDRHPATGHPLPDLPPHCRLPAGHPQRGAD